MTTKWTTPRRSLSRRLKAPALAIAICVVAATSGCGSGDSGGGTLRVAISSEMGPSWAPIVVADEQGFFEEEGIDVEIQIPGSSGDVLQSMEVGRTDIGAPTPEAILAGIDQGQDLKMIYEWTRGPVTSLAVEKDSDIKSIGDLEGATLGVSSLSSGSKILSDAMVELDGLDPSSDVKYLAVGNGVAAWDALDRGRVDGLMLWDTEYAVMKNAGAELRTIRPKELNDLFATTFVAGGDWLEDHDEEAAAFGRAFAKATVWATENPEEAVRTVWDQYPQVKTSSNEDEILPQQVQIFESRNEIATIGNPGKSMTWGKYDENAIEHWVQFAADNGITDSKLDPSSVYTNEFVEQYNDFDPDAVREDAASEGS